MYYSPPHLRDNMSIYWKFPSLSSGKRTLKIGWDLISYRLESGGTLFWNSVHSVLLDVLCILSGYWLLNRLHKPVTKHLCSFHYWHLHSYRHKNIQIYTINECRDWKVMTSRKLSMHKATDWVSQNAWRRHQHKLRGVIIPCSGWTPADIIVLPWLQTDHHRPLFPTK